MNTIETSHTCTCMDGHIRTGSEILKQLHALRVIRRELVEENTELRALLVDQNTVIEQYANHIHTR